MKTIDAVHETNISMNRNQVRSETTRGTILRVAREIFLRKGYYQSTLDEILQVADVSKVAFYHHFKSKADAFLGVYVEMHSEIAQAAMDSAAKSINGWEALIATFDRYFLEVSPPDVYRLLLLDAKSVLTRATQMEIDNKFGNAVVAQVVQRAINEGFISRDLEPQTPVIVGGVVDCLVDWSASQPEPTASLQIARAKFMSFLQILRNTHALN